MLLFSALVAGSFSLGARVAAVVDPVAFTALRFWIAAGAIAAGLWATGGLRRPRAPWRQGALGVLYALYFVLMFEGLKDAPPGQRGGGVHAHAAHGRGLRLVAPAPKAPRADGPGARPGRGGGALGDLPRRPPRAARARPRAGRGRLPRGCVAHALYTPLVARWNRGEGAAEFSLGVVVAGALLVTGLGAGRIVATDWAALPPLAWATLLYVALAASAAAMVLLQFAALRLPAAKVMAYTYLVPAWVLGWEAALGAAPPPALVAVGVALTAAALLLLLRPDPR